MEQQSKRARERYQSQPAVHCLASKTIVVGFLAKEGGIPKTEFCFLLCFQRRQKQARQQAACGLWFAGREKGGLAMWLKEGRKGRLRICARVYDRFLGWQRNNEKDGVTMEGREAGKKVKEARWMRRRGASIFVGVLFVY